MKELRDHRAKRAARHDDRSLGPERATGPDGDCRRDRFQNGYLRFNLAALEQNCLNRLWDTMTADSLRTVTRHEADDETTNHRHENFQPAKMVARGRNHSGAPALVEEQVGENSNQSQQGKSDERAEYTDADRQEGNRDHIAGSGKVTQRLRSLVMLVDSAHNSRDRFAKPHFEADLFGTAAVARIFSGTLLLPRVATMTFFRVPTSAGARVRNSSR